MVRRATFGLAILIIIVVTLGACIGNDCTESAPPPPVPSANITVPQVDADLITSDAVAGLEARLEYIYAAVNPSVVNIRVVQKQSVSSIFPEIPFFQFETPDQPREYYSQAQGSGFVWDTRGNIVTNNHVVADADHIWVTFYDGTMVEGTIVGTDPDSDLAVVKVDTSEGRLLPVELADSSEVKVGQLAASIGNPFGLEGSMTVGFVSALGRLLPVGEESVSGGSYNIPDVIQTDAPINPGNSGGVLVDSSGKVIGVPSAIISPVRASAGIGFAIPSNIVAKVVPSLIETGHYEHTWLGISGMSLTPDVAKAMGLEATQRGALVIDVLPDSPADDAGLRGSDRQVTIDGDSVRIGGDVIVGIDSEQVNGMDDIISYLARATEVGQTVTLTVLREGKQTKIEVKLGARPSSENTALGKDETGGSVAGTTWLGIAGTSLTPDIAEAMGLPSDQKGVLVVQVVANSPADRAGLRGSYKPVVIKGQQVLVGGDVITAVDEEQVNTMENLQEVIHNREPGDKVELQILRSGTSLTLDVTLGKQPE